MHNPIADIISAVDQDLTFAAGTTQLTQCIDDIEVLENNRIDGLHRQSPLFEMNLFQTMNNFITMLNIRTGTLTINDITGRYSISIDNTHQGVR